MPTRITAASSGAGADIGAVVGGGTVLPASTLMAEPDQLPSNTSSVPCSSAEPHADQDAQSQATRAKKKRKPRDILACYHGASSPFRADCSQNRARNTINREQ